MVTTIKGILILMWKFLCFLNKAKISSIVKSNIAEFVIWVTKVHEMGFSNNAYHKTTKSVVVQHPRQVDTSLLPKQTHDMWE